MLEKIIHQCLKQRNLIIVFSLILALAGVYSYLKLPIDAFPDVTNIQVEIVSNAPGLSALEIERFVTYPVEMSMRGLPDVEQLRSVTRFGLSVVTIVFKDNVDVYFARQLVFERLEEAGKNLPKGVTVSMGPVATAMGEIYQFTLDGKMPSDSVSKVKYLTGLRTLQEWMINPLLKSVPGVNEVNSFGGYFRQFQVTVSPEKLLKYNLTVEDVYKSVASNNQNVGGNIIDRNSQQIIVRGIGLIKDIRDIGNIVLKSVNGVPVFVKDVASVGEGESVRQGASLVNGNEEAVGGIVMMLRGENGKEVVKLVEEKVKEINENNLLPDGIKIKPYYDRTDIVQSSVNTVLKALLEGAVLVLVILYLLLRNFRGAVVVLISLPLSLLTTFIVMKSTGLGANLMSLGGLAISLGMIIDATIIQVENVQRHLGEKIEGESKLTTVLKAVLEVRKPSIFGELIIAVTFLPIITLQGLEGKMFTPLALTVAVALLSSLLISIFIIPVLSSFILKKGEEKESIIVRWAKKIYTPLLGFSMRNRTAVVLFAVVLLLATVYIIPKLGSEFIPIMDEGAFDMDVQLLPGVSLTKSLEVNEIIGKKLLKFPELQTIVSRTGQTGISIEARGVEKTGYTGIMKPRAEWENSFTREELIDKMREELSTIPGIAFSFSQPIQCRIDELIAGTKAQLIIKLFGENMDVLKDKAEEISRIVMKIKGAKDVVVEKVSGQPYLSINIDRDRIARYGLNVENVQSIIEIAIGGKTATDLFEENKSFNVVVRFPQEYRTSIDNIKSTLVRSPQGYDIPLSQIADIKYVEGPVQVSREDGSRRIGIELNIKDRDIGSFVSEAKEKIKKGVKLPSGYYTTWGGQFENSERAMKRLMIIAPIAIGLILMLLFVTFRSMKLTMLVISNLPFALIGGVFSLYISGQYLSVPASIGFIVLFGVAVLNGVVLVSYISQLREDGYSLEDAIKMGCNNRLRPVLMTALISIFSLIPMLFATGPGSEIQKPLATVVIGGLFTSTFLTLVVIPTVYGWFDSRKTENEI